MSDLKRQLWIRLSHLGPASREIVFQPEPRWIGDAERAHALLDGVYRFAGQEIVAPGIGPWRLISPNEDFTDALHGFEWLDDCEAAGTRETRRTARSWVFGWIAQYVDGGGPGWKPEVVGRRLIHWISHAPLILDGKDADLTRRFLRACAIQARYLRRAARTAPAGLPRLEALCGWLYAALALDCLRAGLPQAKAALGAEVARCVDGDGGMDSRSPEELCETLVLLATAARTLEAAGEEPDQRHLDAIHRIVPALRALRLGDGGLARFHGGGAGAFGRVDHALTQADLRGAPRVARALGFHRLAAGRTLALIDVAPPPPTPLAQASTLGFELSSGAHRLIVAPGPGARFGSRWADICRVTAAHSTLTIERTSSARIAAAAKGPGPHPFAQGPGVVAAETAEDASGAWLMCSHDGYLPTHGLLHERRVFLSPDGRDFRGEDTLSAPTPRARKRFDKVVEGTRSLGMRYSVRFHLHPDVDVRVDAKGAHVVLGLPDSDWTMSQDGGRISIEDSVFFDESSAAPRATKQIVVSARAKEYWGRVTWAFRRVDRPRAPLRAV